MWKTLGKHVEDFINKIYECQLFHLRKTNVEFSFSAAFQIKCLILKSISDMFEYLLLQCVI